MNAPETIAAKKTRKRLTFESWAQSQGETFALAARTVSQEDRDKIMAAQREGIRAANIADRINRTEVKLATLKRQCGEALDAHGSVIGFVDAIKRVEQAIKGEQGSR